MEKVNFKYVAIVMITLKVSLVSFLLWKIFTSHPNPLYTFSFDKEFLLFIAAGFVAQIIDGALGMAYGVSCSTMLLGIGVPPAIASASVHTAEVFTTGVSGLSHIFMRNIDKKLFFRLVFTGVAGAIVGAFLISKVLDGKLIKPYIAGYLLLLGIYILVKSVRQIPSKQSSWKFAPILGFFGALFDSIGGGGWGPIVSSNLIDKGNSPREVIGTVNTAEFFVTFFSTGVFIFFLGIEAWKPVLALIIGGVIAAPIGAFILRFMTPKTIMRLVGFLIITISSYTIYKSVG
ncbi:MAG: sulfite exporter TauE/SafE family protein [Sphingobacteriales bacterium]|nr:sulfite exporter TauE/SafE family protein [Sphingobacteriales bacterium]